MQLTQNKNTWFISVAITSHIFRLRTQKYPQAKISKPMAYPNLWDLKTLSQPPAYRVVSRNSTWGVVFQGPDFHHEQREVFAYYTTPSIRKHGYQQDDETYPGVVLVHGGGGHAFQNCYISQSRKPHGHGFYLPDYSKRMFRFQRIAYSKRTTCANRNMKKKFFKCSSALDDCLTI